MIYENIVSLTGCMLACMQCTCGTACHGGAENAVNDVKLTYQCACHEIKLQDVKTRCHAIAGRTARCRYRARVKCGPADRERVICGPENADICCGPVGKLRT